MRTPADIAAGMIGVLAALGVMALFDAMFTPGVAGIDTLKASNLEPLGASKVATAIGMVFASFFCGGWVYGALRGPPSGPLRVPATSAGGEGTNSRARAMRRRWGRGVL